MANPRGNGAIGGPRRRWTFAACAFDEASWTLTVNGKRVAVETKPLEILRELLLHPGDVVSKSELLDRIWPDVTVVEASLPTAVRKLRLALGDDRRSKGVIETVAGIGYRLGVPVEVAEIAAADAATVPTGVPTQAVAGKPGRRLAAIGGVAVAFAAMALTLGTGEQAARQAAPDSKRDQLNALRKLDVAAVERMLAAGWDPNAPYDRDGNGALNIALNNCEWDPGHDRRKMLLLARTLIDGGARIDRRNAWGDTAYSIAKAERYCGPDHPVTRMIQTLCYAGYKPTGDRCLASYELAAAKQGGGEGGN